MTQPTNTPSETELERYARLLEQSPNYRLLRRLSRRRKFSEQSEELGRLAAILDLETTGLDVQQDEILELGIVKFRFSARDEIIEVVDEYSGLNEPSIGVPEEIEVLTGISQDEVIGKKLDLERVQTMLEDVSLIVAHNASFDRPLFERYLPSYRHVNWACSATEIDWKAEGRFTAKLEFLLSCNGYFYESHRALDDCYALLELLATPLPSSQVPAFAQMIRTAREIRYRIFAVGAPFEARTTLKKRGYRWSDGTVQKYKAWWKDLIEQDLPAEISFLQETIVHDSQDFPTVRISALNRYRAELPD